MNDEPPARNERYARYLALNLTKTLDDLADTYAKAKARNDAALFGQFNKLRQSVQTQVEFLTAIRNEFPPDQRHRIDTAIENGQSALQQVDPVPEEVELAPAALENFTRRLLNTNSVSAHNLDNSPPLSPPPLRFARSANDVSNHAEGNTTNPPPRSGEDQQTEPTNHTLAFTAPETRELTTPAPPETTAASNEQETAAIHVSNENSEQPEIIWEKTTQREPTDGLPPELARYLRKPIETYDENHDERLTPCPTGGYNGPTSEGLRATGQSIPGTPFTAGLQVRHALKELTVDDQLRMIEEEGEKELEREMVELKNKIASKTKERKQFLTKGPENPFANHSIAKAAHTLPTAPNYDTAKSAREQPQHTHDHVAQSAFQPPPARMSYFAPSPYPTLPTPTLQPRSFAEAATARTWTNEDPNQSAIRPTKGNWNNETIHRPQAVKPTNTMPNRNHGVSIGTEGYGGGHANNNWTQGTYENSIGAQILSITTQSVARDLLVSARPPPEKRFSGDGRGIDFESHLNLFNMNTERQGISDLMKVLEVKHWFSGQALKVCELYDSEPDPKTALRKIKHSLKKEYSHQSMSAHRMLEDILAGKQIGRKDAKSLQFLVLGLEKTYKRAQDTNRQSDFDSKDTIDAILIRRLMCFVTAWSDKCAKKKLRWDPDVRADSDDEDHNEKALFKITFNDFLSFIKQKQQAAAWESGIMTRLQREQTMQTRIAAACLETVDEDQEQEREQEGHEGETEGENIAAATMTRVPKRLNNNKTTPPPNTNRNFNNNNSNNYYNNPHNNYNNGATQRTNGYNAQRPNANPQRIPETRNNANAPWRCVIDCGRNSFHSLDKCADFMKMDEKERMSVVRRKGLCIGCLSGGHLLANCKSVKCECGGQHHSILHRDEWIAAS